MIDSLTIVPSVSLRERLEVIPAELRALRQWVAWKSAPQSHGRKPRKIPIDAKSLRAASSTDPDTWSSWEEAVSAAEANTSLAGVGFVLTESDAYCGVDLDDCIVSGQLTAGALRVISEFDSYCEYSPSGRGVKLLINARKSSTKCKSKKLDGAKEVEIYDHDRFWTMTGARVLGTSLHIEERQVELDALMLNWFGAAVAHAATTNGTYNGTLIAPPLPASVRTDPGARECLNDPAEDFLSDDEIIERASKAANGAKFESLWSGDTSGHNDDDSSADLALCNHLAFWTGLDAARIDSLFRRSGLYRPKWDEKRGAQTYGERTIAVAISGCKDIYTPGYIEGAPTMNGTNGTAPRERLILDPRRTLPTAEAFIEDHHAHADRPTLLAWCGSFYEWRAGGWQELDDAALRARMTAWLHDAAMKTKDGAAPFPANPTTTAAAIETLRDSVHLSAATTLPCWLDGRADRPRADELLATRSGLLHLPTGSVIPPTPMLFTTAALPFEYDPGAPRPERWLRFLDEVFNDDAEAIQLAREWAGYILTPDTRQHKIMLAVGPKRSGKGTVAGNQSEHVGAGNYAAPTTSSLAGTFGLQPLLGRSLAIIGDARFRGRDTSVVVERLLTISGGDPITVDCKYAQSITTKLAVRFVILSNELPRLADAAGALQSRFLILPFQRSFIGQEDICLADALREELPGILNWAIEGWKSLNARGRFVMPASAADMQAEIEDLGAPVAAFVRDRCEVGAGLRAGVDELHAEYINWCATQNIRESEHPSKAVFGRELSAAFPSIVKKRIGAGGAGGAAYIGVAIQ